MAANLLELILTNGRNDQVIMALSGQEGLIKAEQEQPNLIIVRIMMSLDGYEICRRLKQIPALADVPGVISANINLASEKATVEYTEDVSFAATKANG